MSDTILWLKLDASNDNHITNWSSGEPIPADGWKTISDPALMAKLIGDADTVPVHFPKAVLDADGNVTDIVAHPRVAADQAKVQEEAAADRALARAVTTPEILCAVVHAAHELKDQLTAKTREKIEAAHADVTTAETGHAAAKNQAASKHADAVANL